MSMWKNVYEVLSTALDYKASALPSSVHDTLEALPKILNGDGSTNETYRLDKAAATLYASESWNMFSAICTDAAVAPMLRNLQGAGFFAKLMPEVEQCVGLAQNKKYHTDPVFEHCVKTCEAAREICAVQRNRDKVTIAVAAFFHDVGKGATMKVRNGKITFYKHDVVGMKITRAIMGRFGILGTRADHVAFLVRDHMYNYESDTYALFNGDDEVDKTRCGSPRDCMSLPQFEEGMAVRLVKKGWKDSTLRRQIDKLFLSRRRPRTISQQALTRAPLLILRRADRASRGMEPITKKHLQMMQRIRELETKAGPRGGIPRL